MKLYHGTNLKNKKLILENGFKKGYGVLGNAVYLTSDKDFAKRFGTHIITVEVDDKYIINNKEIQHEMFYGGFSNIEDYCNNRNIKALQDKYFIINNGKITKRYTEVGVYDISIIKILKKVS